MIVHKKSEIAHVEQSCLYDAVDINQNKKCHLIGSLEHRIYHKENVCSNKKKNLINDVH